MLIPNPYQLPQVIRIGSSLRLPVLVRRKTMWELPLVMT